MCIKKKTPRWRGLGFVFGFGLWFVFGGGVLGSDFVLVLPFGLVSGFVSVLFRFFAFGLSYVWVCYVLLGGFRFCLGLLRAFRRVLVMFGYFFGGALVSGL